MVDQAVAVDQAVSASPAAVDQGASVFPAAVDQAVSAILAEEDRVVAAILAEEDRVVAAIPVTAAVEAVVAGAEECRKIEQRPWRCG